MNSIAAMESSSDSMDSKIPESSLDSDMAPIAILVSINNSIGRRTVTVEVFQHLSKHRYSIYSQLRSNIACDGDTTHPAEISSNSLIK